MGPMQSTSDPQKPLIVLVEDDQGTRLLFGMTLEVEGFEVVSYETGEEALVGLADLRPAALVTDLSLAGDLSGIDLARQVRDISHCSEIDLFAITGWDLDRIDADDAALFRKVFVKPIDTMVISDALRHALRA